ncbi:MAG: SDR family oxidoreductase [Deltaproteobacteria bacterium]|nr:SDR family oxidoreductase [Deltaproteobacteria bacterium]
MAKSIFLTGASAGLGEGMARGFAKRGYALALAARSRDKLEALAQELRGAGAAKVMVYSLDVTDFESVPRVIGEAAAEMGGLDIVIANSGIGVPTPAGRGTFEAARRTIDTNLTGAIATVDAAVELFRKQRRGHIVAISSVAAVRGLPGQGAYSASKSGLSRYLEAVRAELAGTDIHVTDLAPGYIDTDLNRSMPSRPFLVSTEKGTEMMVAMIEKQVGFRYVPVMPWTLVAQVLKVLPARLLAKAG